MSESPEDYYLNQALEELGEAFDDPRFTLALALARHRGNERVVLDLTDLLLGGWLEPDEVPHLTAQRRLANEVTASGPVIVVTEGSTDARLLAHALRLSEPDLAASFSFLDFEGTSNPGGADKVVSLVRGMAAASVMNRIIAVLDNDTAGREAQRVLLQGQLPSHITVTRLPDVPYASRYPADGPEGRQLSLVNGRVAAIDDVRTSRTSPGEWRGVAACALDKLCPKCQRLPRFRGLQESDSGPSRGSAQRFSPTVGPAPRTRSGLQASGADAGGERS